MGLETLLKSVELFNGLGENELGSVERICHELHLGAGEVVARQGEIGDELYIIAAGFVEVVLETDPPTLEKVVVQLGPGQIIGEMGLLDHGPRSATIRTVSDPTILQTIRRQDLESLCDQDQHIGYLIMRNLALDIAFKLRHRNAIIR